MRTRPPLPPVLYLPDGSDTVLMPKIFISYRRDHAPFEAAWIRLAFIFTQSEALRGLIG
jgi:hypothetical protein